MSEAIPFNKYQPPHRTEEEIKNTIEFYEKKILNLLNIKKELLFSEIRDNLKIGKKNVTEKQYTYDSIKNLIDQKLIRISGLETPENHKLKIFDKHTIDTYFKITPEGEEWLNKNK